MARFEERSQLVTSSEDTFNLLRCAPILSPFTAQTKRNKNIMNVKRRLVSSTLPAICTPSSTFNNTALESVKMSRKGESGRLTYFLNVIVSLTAVRFETLLKL